MRSTSFKGRLKSGGIALNGQFSYIDPKGVITRPYIGCQAIQIRGHRLPITQISVVRAPRGDLKPTLRREGSRQLVSPGQTGQVQRTSDPSESVLRPNTGPGAGARTHHKAGSALAEQLVACVFTGLAKGRSEAARRLSPPHRAAPRRSLASSGRDRCAGRRRSRPDRCVNS